MSWFKNEQGPTGNIGYVGFQGIQGPFFSKKKKERRFYWIVSRILYVVLFLLIVTILGYNIFKKTRPSEVIPVNQAEVSYVYLKEGQHLQSGDEVCFINDWTNCSPIKNEVFPSSSKLTITKDDELSKTFRRPSSKDTFWSKIK